VSFVLLIAFALCLPALLSRSGAVTRQRSYELMPEQHGAYSFVRSQIFEDGSDIDILFVGSSIQWNAIDTPQVQAALSDTLGRKANVVSFGFNFNGIDIPYAELRDVLERRRVRLVIFSIPRLPFNDGPNATAYKFLGPGDDEGATAGLPFRYRSALYAGAVLRSPHDLLRIVESIETEPSKYAADLGANKETLGMGRKSSKFVRFVPASPRLPVRDLLLSDTTREHFEFTNESLPPYQEHYLDEIAKLLHRCGTPLAMINVPQYNERSSTKVIERQDWARRLGSDVPLIGVPPATLFEGLSPDEVEKLHCDIYHFNKNGNEFFTRTVLPAILHVYDTHAAK
jgi:hypothetical protein